MELLGHCFLEFDDLLELLLGVLDLLVIEFEAFSSGGLWDDNCVKLGFDLFEFFHVEVFVFFVLFLDLHGCGEIFV